MIWIWNLPSWDQMRCLLNCFYKTHISYQNELALATVIFSSQKVTKSGIGLDVGCGQEVFFLIWQHLIPLLFWSFLLLKNLTCKFNYIELFYTFFKFLFLSNRYRNPERNLNLGPKAFSLLEFEIAPYTTRPPRPVGLALV